MGILIDLNHHRFREMATLGHRSISGGEWVLGGSGRMQLSLWKPGSLRLIYTTFVTCLQTWSRYLWLSEWASPLIRFGSSRPNSLPRDAMRARKGVMALCRFWHGSWQSGSISRTLSFTNKSKSEFGLARPLQTCQVGQMKILFSDILCFACHDGPVVQNIIISPHRFIGGHLRQLQVPFLHVRLGDHGRRTLSLRDKHLQLPHAR